MLVLKPKQMLRPTTVQLL